MRDEDMPLTDEELALWLAFDQMTGLGLGARRLFKLYERFDSLGRIWNGSTDFLRSIGFSDEQWLEKFTRRKAEIDPPDLLGRLRDSGIQVLPVVHPKYPLRLREIHDFPLLLFVSGRMRESDFDYNIAVVGTRRPTSYGSKLAKEVARGLSANGVTIVSGMAIGIDSLAHWGAMEGGARTIAVLGCGPDVCYPSSNKRLLQEILEKDRGIILSEYFPGTKPEPWRFPARNRIVSGLCQAVVVVEGDVTSGSMITAQTAFEQSREVFAFPGRVDNPMSRGPHALVRRDTAHLCTSYEDILEDMNWVKSEQGREIPTVIELWGREKEVFEMLSGEPVHFEVLCERTGMPPGEMAAVLTMLELGGVVIRHPGDWYSRYNQDSRRRHQPTLPG